MQLAINPEQLYTWLLLSLLPLVLLELTAIFFFLNTIILSSPSYFIVIGSVKKLSQINAEACQAQSEYCHVSKDSGLFQLFLICLASCQRIQLQGQLDVHVLYLQSYSSHVRAKVHKMIQHHQKPVNYVTTSQAG